MKLIASILPIQKEHGLSPACPNIFGRIERPHSFV